MVRAKDPVQDTELGRGIRLRFGAWAAPSCNQPRSKWQGNSGRLGLEGAATSVALPKKSILNLGVNCVEPLLRSVGPLSIGRAFSFQFCNPILGCAQLIGKLLSHAQCATAVLFSNSGSLVN